MKKLVSLLLVVILASLLVFSMTACGKTEECVFCGEACSKEYQNGSGDYACKDCYTNKTEECVFCNKACSKKYQNAFGFVCEDCADQLGA